MARDFGGIEQLLPDGIADIRDCPYPLFDAIQMGLQFLGWQENLDKDEMPPRAIWFNSDDIVEWFEMVETRRKEKYGGESDGPGEIEDEVRNPVARSLLVGG